MAQSKNGRVASRRPRVQFIDASRATAMMFVLISHFGGTFFEPDDPRGLLLQRIGLIASPTFMLISGALVGLLYRTAPDGFGRLRAKLIDRGLFLLSIGHLLLMIGCWPLLQTSRHILITDVIGIAMIAGPWLILRTTPRTRILLSCAAFMASWLVVLSWHPQTTAAQIFQESVFGSLQPSFYVYAFPLLPWFCLDLVGSAIGESIGARLVNGSEGRALRLVATLGACAMSLGVIARSASHVLSGSLGGNPVVELFDHLTSFGQKVPPSPGYLCFYGGIGLMLMTMVMLVDQRQWLPRLTRVAVSLGQTTLVIFVLQFYVYDTAIFLTHRQLPMHSAWPVYFGLTALLVLLPALEWNRRGYRRFITVGYERWWESRRRRTAPVPMTLPPMAWEVRRVS